MSDSALDFSEPYRMPSAEKQAWLIAELNALTRFHCSACSEYAGVVTKLFGGREEAAKPEALPFLAVGLFKFMDLKSVPQDQVVRVLTSSGTSGQTPSRILLDKATAAHQTMALAAITSYAIGKQRLPMVIVDNREVVQSRTSFSARAAGVVGFSLFGRNHFYLLNEKMEVNWDGLDAFIDVHKGSPILLFGFTFVVWQFFYKAAEAAGRKVAWGGPATLIHGGGWKKLEDQQVSNKAYKAALAQRLGIDSVLNYYGMVEQVGSVFMECSEGRLHTPRFADVLIRDPLTLEPLPQSESGLIQMLSTLPRSYPGHSLLTEDLGTVTGEDDCPCGRLGKTLRVDGRLPKAEMRGCSDVRTYR